MTDDRNSTPKSVLGNQGQSWKAIDEGGSFERPGPIFDRPMEITVNMLRGLRMVDETVVVYGAPSDGKGA
jgi:hypothetical protein